MAEAAVVVVGRAAVVAAWHAVAMVMERAVGSVAVAEGHAAVAGHAVVAERAAAVEGRAASRREPSGAVLSPRNFSRSTSSRPSDGTGTCATGAAAQASAAASGGSPADNASKVDPASKTAVMADDAMPGLNLAVAAAALSALFCFWRALLAAFVARTSHTP